MEGFGEAQKLTAYATPEVRTLFEDWVRRAEEEVLGFVKEGAATNPEEIAVHLKISTDSAIFLVNKLAREGKLRIAAIEVAQE